MRVIEEFRASAHTQPASVRTITVYMDRPWKENHSPVRRASLSEMNLNCALGTHLLDSLSQGPTPADQSLGLTKLVNLAMESSAEGKREVGSSFHSLTILGKDLVNLQIPVLAWNVRKFIRTVF